MLIEQLLFLYQQDIFANRATFVRLFGKILANRRTIAHWVYDISCYYANIAIRRIANTRTVLYVNSYAFARGLKIACY